MKLSNMFFMAILWITCLTPQFAHAQKEKSTAETEIVILHVNDMHAKIDNLAKLAFLKDSLKKIHPHVFLFSAGDNFTGNPVVDMVADKGFPMIDLMNQCGFDLSTIGNHEFDLGIDFLEKRFEQAKFPFISCNIFSAGTQLRQPKPYQIFDLGDNITMAVLGVIELGINGIPDSHPSRMKGLKFSEGIETMKKYSFLREDNEVLIALTHLGIHDDARLAESMPQLDLIIGGHSHTLIDSVLIINNVLVTQAGANLKYAGKTTIIIKDGRIESRTDEIIPLSKVLGSNKKIEENISRYNSNEELKRVIANTENGIQGYDELGSLMTDAIVNQIKVDFAFQNRGGIRSSSLPAGEIRLSDIYKLDPFGNQIVIFNMNLKEINSLICNAFNREKGLDLEVSGMTYTVHTDTARKCSYTELLDPSGNPFDDSRVYRVAMNSYMAASYIFEHQDPGETIYTTTAQALIEYLTAVKKVEYTGIKRIKAIRLKK